MKNLSVADFNRPVTNLFSSDIYLSSLAKIYFPETSFSIKNFNLDGFYYRLLVIDKKKIITSFPFMDLLQSVNISDNTAKPIDYLPQVVLETKSYDPITPPKLLNPNKANELAPFIDWQIFADYESFEKMLYQRNSKLITDTRRRCNKLIREKGEITFKFDDPNPQVLKNCIKWKSTHYENIGGTDLFLDPKHISMFQELQNKGLVVVSSLSVNNNVIASHIGAAWQQIFYSWVPAYDRSYYSYAPGRLLLHFLIQETLKQKYKMFDFLLGAEGYKWNYATGYRNIGPYGNPSISIKLINTLTDFQFSFRSKTPAVYYLGKRVLITFKKILYKIK